VQMSFGCSSEDCGAGVRTNARFLTEGMQQKSGKTREKRTRNETRRDESHCGEKESECGSFIFCVSWS
jgi:hypothetical protein